MPLDRKHGLQDVAAIENFEQRFREAFGREMTPNERRYFYLSGIALEDDADTDAVGAGS